MFEKISYYATEFPQVPRLQGWYDTVWKGWYLNKEFVENNYGTHPTAWQDSRTTPYTGIHPEEMNEWIKKN